MDACPCPAPGAAPHVETVCFENRHGPQVRLWHAPDRWGQVAVTSLHAGADPSAAVRPLLAQAGVLPPSSPTTARAVRSILLVGRGPLARTVAAHLDALGVDLQLSSHGATDPGGDGSGVQPWQAELASGSPRGRVRVSRRDPLEAWRPGTLVVVASDTIEVDRDLPARLARRGVEHVLLAAHVDRAAVGPWWRGAADACRGCDDRHAADVDDDYPMVLAQLANRRAMAPPELLDWAAATLTVHVTSAGGAALVNTVEVLDLGDPGAGRRMLTRHPRCPHHAGQEAFPRGVDEPDAGGSDVYGADADGPDADGWARVPRLPSAA